MSKKFGVKITILVEGSTKSTAMRTAADLVQELGEKRVEPITLDIGPVKELPTLHMPSYIPSIWALTNKDKFEGDSTPGSSECTCGGNCGCC